MNRQTLLRTTGAVLLLAGVLPAWAGPAPAEPAAPAASAASAAPAAAAVPAAPGYYAAAQLGRNNLSRWPARVDFGGVGVDGELGLDRGLHGGVAVGRQTEHARFELEYQYGRFDISRMTLGPVSEPGSGGGHYQALTVNAYRTAAWTESLGAYAGVGLGWGAATLPSLRMSNGCNCFAGADHGGWLYQARLGLDYRLGPAHDLFVQYTWLRMPGGSGGEGPTVSYERRHVGAWSVGYRYHF
ncbi:MAG TPA: outer membrane beta-barrel protein [Burkholderiaceae bacterium]|nr:outer membrane beta-barrel protein [Burkholderiaceae bacterium]